MYAVTSLSDAGADPGAALERAYGEARLSVARSGGRTVLREAFQQGSFKLRFPRVFEGGQCEAVLINTAGGVTGGDRFAAEIAAGDGAALTLATQAAEKVYRSPGGEARLAVRLAAGRGARLLWLPQETILFDRGQLARTLDVEMAADATVLLCEAMVLGRTAHGETVRAGALRDRWRVRREGRLVYADDLRIGGEVGAATAGAATLGGACAFASLLLIAPDAEARLDTVRTALDDVPAVAGASAWDGMLAVRAVARGGQDLRRALLRVLDALGAHVPRVWSI
ncbi:MAG: urease accessory protein UreD [Alphaproteobacteria bacterium]|nr:urease accessory protein UreD [Alphaproteobacteria bacterium]MDX5368759.1 urease accessory protein UreD [Alphaproteobacteria bacterium]MDX5463495.1 urease accessory protein UreD [Alphaproteobacteria bacterium]